MAALASACGRLSGSSWEVAGGIGTTANQTLVRKPDITSGNTVALGSFGTDEASSEWIIYEANTVAYIGFFGDLTEPFISANTSGFIGNFGFVANGSSSDASSYSVSAQNLTEDLVITAPAGFELSLDEALVVRIIFFTLERILSSVSCLGKNVSISCNSNSSR